MSVCTQSEIAEKKRIALERLRAKKVEAAKPPNIVVPPPAKITSYVAPKPVNKASEFMRVMQENVRTNHRKREQGRASAQPYLKESPFRKKGREQSAPPEQHVSSNVRVVTCRLEIIAADRFVIVPSEFHSKVIDVCKSIPSRIYDPAKRVWSFHIKDYDLLQERIGALKPNIVIGTIPKNIMKICTCDEMANEETAQSCLVSINKSLVDTLLPFQKEGVCFGINKQGRILIADEMGLGKTHQALAIADFYKEDWPLLISTTASTKSGWVSHIHKLLPDVACQYIFNINASHEFFDDAKIVICSHALMEKCLDKLKAMNFGVLIMDESHALKNPKAKCTIVANTLAKKAKRVILLSGTPALSRPVELYSQLKMLDPKFLNFMEYSVRYCNGKQGQFAWDSSGQSNFEELNLILRKKFMIRRVKADVLPQLAEKNRQTVYLDPALIKTNAALANFHSTFSQLRGGAREEMLLQFYSETAHVKCSAVCSYLKSILKTESKFIVFAHHKILMDAISDCFQKLNVQHIRIDGSTKSEHRSRFVKQFQKDGKCQVALLSLKACNSGITLTAAKLILFAELDWNPSTLAQAESRAHRIGQEGTVVCRYLLARNTADDTIWEMLKSKQNVLDKAGLCSEKLQDSEHIAGPNTAGNIEKYLVRTPIKNQSPNKQHTSTCENAPKTPKRGSGGDIEKFVVKTPRKNDLANCQVINGHRLTGDVQDLLNDDNDDDFGDIEVFV